MITPFRMAAAAGMKLVPHMSGGSLGYLDLVHFTLAGNNKMAKTMFDGLSDAWRKDPRLNCYDRR